MEKFDRLQVVFKVVERCNINCDYCYYFNMGDHSSKARPPVVDIATTRRIADWLAEGCDDLGIEALSIAFHGGEPMMLKARNFDAICTAFTDGLARGPRPAFSMQTNGTIMSDAWLATLRRHRVHLGISIDGDRMAHDRHRRDHRDRSTFDKTEATLDLIAREARGEAAHLGPATISVMDAANDYRAIFAYLRDRGVERMSFLLPDRSHDMPFLGGGDTAEAYGDALFDIFAAWFENDDPGIAIRFVTEFLSHLQLAPEGTDAEFPAFAKDSGRPVRRTQVIIMHSDGRVGIDDSLIPALDWFSATPEMDVASGTLRQFLSDPIFAEIAAARANLAPTCRTCRWREPCGGGDLENRYRRGTGFANPSVYCAGLKHFYTRATKLLVANGYPAGYVKRALAA